MGLNESHADHNYYCTVIGHANNRLMQNKSIVLFLNELMCSLQAKLLVFIQDFSYLFFLHIVPNKSDNFYSLHIQTCIGIFPLVFSPCYIVS